MSTKIHNGYRLPAGSDPFTFLDELRLALDPVRDRIDAELLINRAMAYIDDVTAAPADKVERGTEIRAAYREFTNTQRSLSATDRAHDPHRFELSLSRDPLTEQLALLIYTEEKALHDTFLTVSGAETYGYWNNTDRPEGTTEAEWVDRKEFWDRILGDSTAAERMLTWRLRSDNLGMAAISHDIQNGTYDPAQLAALIPSTTDRATRIAEKLVIHEGFNLSDKDKRVSAIWTLSRSEGYPEVVDAIANVLIPVSPTDLMSNKVLNNALEAHQEILTQLAHIAARRLLGIDVSPS